MINLTFSGINVFPPETEATGYMGKVQDKINADSTPVDLIKKNGKSIQWFNILRYSLVAASVAMLIRDYLLSF